MSLLLYPRGAPSDRLRVWVGVSERVAAPPLTWTLTEKKGGAAVALPAGQPVALRPIKSVRTDDPHDPHYMLPPGKQPADVPRVFAGVYEFNAPRLKPATDYVVTVRADDNGESLSQTIRTLPAAVPRAMNETFNVLLVSCFHQAEDRTGLVGVGATRLTGADQPHLTLLLGDQVYLDLPSHFTFPDTTAELAADFEKKYLANWGGPEGYSRVLATAPSISVPDDHEFWNNYPHKFPFVRNTERDEGRERWAAAARALYEGFQLPAPTQTGAATIIDVPPVSFFLADTRSNRDFNFGFVIDPRFFGQFVEWVDRVSDPKNKMYGVFISGQSLFRGGPPKLSGGDDKPNNKGIGKVGDFELYQYDDFGPIVQQLARFADAGRPLICITGDVHFGRFVAARDRRRLTGQAAIYEIISSPASLVTTPLVDTFTSAVNIFKAGFHFQTEPWPRHAAADQPPPFFGQKALPGRFACEMLDQQRGNHVALLSFRDTGGGNLEARLKYFPLHANSAFNTPREPKGSPLILSPLI